jgi:hypothetical protein
MSLCSSQWYSLACLGCVSHVINRKINKRASHIISEKLLSLLFSTAKMDNHCRWRNNNRAKGAYNFIMSKLPVDVYV